MVSENAKIETPPYSSYGTFTNFINGLKQTGVPSRIDKSIMNKLSGSAQAALLSTLKWLKLVDDVGMPAGPLHSLVNLDKPEYSAVLEGVIRNSYTFLMDGSLDLMKATGGQVEKKFRDIGIQGSTVIKCVLFFIAAAKDADIPLGPHIKAPKAPSRIPNRKNNNIKSEEESDNNNYEETTELEGLIKITIPLHGMKDGLVYLPDGLTKPQWAYALKITKFILENYRDDSSDDWLGGA